MNKENNPNKCPICGRPTHKESKYCIFHAGAEEKTEEEFKEALKEYIQKIKEENKNYYFGGFIFVGDIDFNKDLNVVALKRAYFSNTIFEGNAVFRKTIFEEGTIFNNANFKKFATFRNTAFEGFAAFCNVNFKKYAGFRNVTFKGNVDFRKTIFEGNAVFAKAIFEKNASFKNAIFKEDSDFGGVTFKKDSFFNSAIFKKYAGFKNTIFKEDSVFGGVIFERNIGFGSATFHGNTGFMNVIFRGNTHFEDATFKGFVVFAYATFYKIAFFCNVTFEEFAGFKGTTFKENAYFNVKNIVGKLSFSNAILTSGKTLNIEIKEVKKRIIVEFKKTYLENIYLELFLKEKVLIDFTDALLRNTKFTKDQVENHIYQEERKEFSRAKEIYLLLKNNFHSIGKYDDESWAFTKERDMERLSHSYPFYIKGLKGKGKIEKLPILKWIKKGYFKKWIISVFSNKIYGYGEKPWNVIITAGVLILMFALFFSVIGIGNPEIIELKGTVIHQNSGNIVDLVSKGLLKNNVIRNFPDSLYFSLITFTTLGYGDFRPLEGWGRILAGSEAFIGAFMMALFVYTFARRTGGR